MRARVILNKNSGTSQEATQELEKKLIAEFVAAGIAAEISFVDGSDIKNAAESAVQDNVDVVIAGGGDGTVSAVASVLAGKEIPMGILPLGTLNHFAKDLKIPLDVKQAIAVIAGQRKMKIDVGEVNGRTFINNSSIGMYPWVVKRRERHQSDLHIGKWRAMALAWKQCFKHFPLSRVKLISEKKTLSLKTPFVFIGNNEYRLDPLGFGGRTELDKGSLSVFTVKHEGRMGLVRVALRALLGGLKRVRNVTCMQMPWIEIETRERVVPVSLDGEVIHLQPPLRYSVRPKSLSVMIP
jgi:diacylglycerol kinase family enzyme